MRFTGNSSRGFALVELLIALLLGMLLSAALVTGYITAKRHYIYVGEIARLQENARFAMRILSREVAQAGFFAGLADPTQVVAIALNTDCGSPPWALDTAQPLDMVNNHLGSDPPLTASDRRLACLNGAEVQPGSDLLAVKRSFSAPSILRGTLSPAVTFSDSPTWFLRLDRGAQPTWSLHPPGDLASVTSTQQSFWEASARVFFIRRYANEPGDNVPTLCMETLAGNGMEVRCLVEGVEDMQFEFGIDVDGDGAPNRYVSAPDDSQLSAAVTVRIALLLRTLAPLPAALGGRSVRVLGELRGATDAFSRRLVTTTVPLRNKGLR